MGPLILRDSPLVIDLLGKCWGGDRALGLSGHTGQLTWVQILLLLVSLGPDRVIPSLKASVSSVNKDDNKSTGFLGVVKKPKSTEHI